MLGAQHLANFEALMVACTFLKKENFCTVLYNFGHPCQVASCSKIISTYQNVGLMLKVEGLFTVKPINKGVYGLGGISLATILYN